MTLLLVSLAVSAALACDEAAQPAVRSTATAPTTATGIATTPTPLQTPSETQAVPRAGPSLTRLPAGAQTAKGLYIYEVESGSIWKVSSDFGWSWSPDGRLLAATAHEDALSRDALYVVDVEAKVSVRAYEAASLNALSFLEMRWSADSGRLAFLAGGGVHTVNRDGTGLRDFQEASKVAYMEWLRNGNRLALEFTHQTPTEPAEYAVVDVESGEVTRVAGGEMIDGIAPRVIFGNGSADGAWVESKEGIQNLVTGQVRQIPALGYVFWAPVGGGFLYWSHEGNRNTIFSARLDGDQITELTNVGLPLVWSPDGQRIVYTGFNCDLSHSDWDIYVSAPDGSNGNDARADRPSARPAPCGCRPTSPSAR